MQGFAKPFRRLVCVSSVLYLNKDFGELAWRSGLPASCGIVLFRLPALGPAGVGKVIADVLMSRDDWPGHFSVVEPGRIRVRVLPPPGAPQSTGSRK